MLGVCQVVKLQFIRNFKGDKKKWFSTVMGHEIAHAVAKHSVERASRGVYSNKR